jgi:hypothetical protein
MKTLKVERDDRGRYRVEVDGSPVGEIRAEPDGLGYESRASEDAKWDWSHSFANAIQWLVGRTLPQ